MVRVSSRIRPTSSRAIRATVPATPAEPLVERVQHDGPVEASRPGLVAGIELVEVPAQAVLRPRALGDEILAVVDQEPQLALLALEGGDREVRVRERRPGDRERVDRIALALLAAVTARSGHEPRRTRSTGSPARSRSDASRRDRWRQSSQANRRCGNRAAQRTSSRCPALVAPTVTSASLAAVPVGRDRGVRALVRIDADDDHLLVAS